MQDKLISPTKPGQLFFLFLTRLFYISWRFDFDALPSSPAWRREQMPFVRFLFGEERGLYSILTCLLLGFCKHLLCQIVPDSPFTSPCPPLSFLSSAHPRRRSVRKPHATFLVCLSITRIISLSWDHLSRKWNKIKDQCHKAVRKLIHELVKYCDYVVGKK